MFFIKELVYIFYFIVCVNSSSPQTSKDDEFFTAASDMDLLLRVERTLGKGLLRYIEKESKNLDILEAEIKKIENELPPKSNDKVWVSNDEVWISQATNAYGILKRFTRFWPSFDKFAKNEKIENIRNSLKTDLKSLEDSFPSEKDLHGALTAITRIQDTYNITAPELIHSLGESQPLDVQELFQMGYLWSEIQDFTHAREWFLEAVKRFPKYVNVIGFLDKASLFEYLAWSEYKLFNINAAIKHTKYVLKIKPAHRIAITNLEIFQDYKKKLKDQGINATDLIKEKNENRNLTWEIGKHNMLCRGSMIDMEINRTFASKLFCKYGHYAPQFIIKPLKIEYMYLEPNITIFHNILMDFEINHIKERATPILSRATVHDVKTGTLSFADYRISKSAWIEPEYDKLVASIYKKIGLATNLDTRSFEPLQVANYGLGGQYEPHYDHATSKIPDPFNTFGGNRMATLLMYMSDVKKGGKTVFTKTNPGASITPTKGTAAFWYNLKRNGESNPFTEHAACPVVFGAKWVSNVWIHEYHQEFKHKCTLNKDD